MYHTKPRQPAQQRFGAAILKSEEAYAHARDRARPGRAVGEIEKVMVLDLAAGDDLGGRRAGRQIEVHTHHGAEWQWIIGFDEYAAGRYIARHCGRVAMLD